MMKKKTRTLKRRLKRTLKRTIGGADDQKKETDDQKKETDDEKKETNDEKKEDELEKSSMEELQRLKDEREENNKKMLEDASIVAQGVTANALEGIGNAVGVDITNPEETTKKLDDIKETLSDPENIEKIKEITAEAAKNGAVIFKAASPLIDPLVEKTIDVGSKSAKKIAESSGTIFSNFIKEIPGVGLAYSLVQDASKIGEAASAVTNATAEITTQTADSAVVFKKNLEQLKKEGDTTENRINSSVEEFEKTNQSGGNHQYRKTNSKKYKNKKTKKVRFFL